MPDPVGFLIGTLFGAVIGVVADRTIGPRIDALQRRTRNWSRRRRAAHTTVDRAIRVGGTTLVVRCSDIASGWRPSQVRIRSHGDRPPIADVAGGSDVAAVLPATDVLEREIEDLRRRMNGEDDAQWNSDHLGPRRIDESRDDNGSYVRIDTDVHDWATHRVLRAHFAERGQSLFHADPLAAKNSIDRLMSTTLRIFMQVVTADGKLVIGRRGTKEGIDQPSTMCTALEAWVLARHVDNGAVRIEDVVSSALEEQLGIGRDQDGVLDDLLFHTILLNLGTRNWSIHGVLDLGRAGITGADLASIRSIAPGNLHWLADPLEFVPLRRKDVQRIAGSGFSGWMPEAVVCLRNSLALHAPGLLERRSPTS